MAKALGLIGNFKGKLGNTVGYSLKDSNNKQTQGVRVYQPVVRNPKTAAQAEQRAKLAPINATYRALKMVIDRGQEGKAYGNKSRLAWLSAAMKAFNGGWFVKGAAINMPALVPLTKGSIAGSFPIIENSALLQIEVQEATAETIATIGGLSTVLTNDYPFLQNGDQLTFVTVGHSGGNLFTDVRSIVIDTTSTDNKPTWVMLNNNRLNFLSSAEPAVAGAIVISREGNNGEHLRSTTSLARMDGYDIKVLDPAAKEAAIDSYMSQGINSDWAEESLK